MTIFLILAGCREFPCVQKQNFSQSRRKSEIDTVVSTLCICGLPIGNWTFVGADSGPSGNFEELASKLRAIRGDRVDSLERCVYH